MLQARIVLALILAAAIISLALGGSIYSITVEASSKTINGNGWSVTLSTNADNYTVGETVIVTVAFSGEFNGTVLLVVTNQTGDNVDGVVENLEQTTTYTYSFTLKKSYGTGTFTVKASVKGSIKTENGIQSLNVGADKLAVVFEVKQPTYTNYVELRGIVVDEADRPLKDVLVYVPDTSIQAYTDANGLFTLYLPSEGVYTIRLEKDDYYPETYTIKVNKTNALIQLKITSLAYQIDLLRHKISELTMLIKTMNETYTDMISTVENKLITLNTTLTIKIASLENQIASLNTLVNKLIENITMISQKIDKIENELVNYATIDYVNSVAENLTTSINKVSTQLENALLAINNSFSEVKASIKELSNTISEMQSAFRDLSKRVQTLTQKQESTEQKVNTNAKAIENLSNSLESLRNETQVNTLLLKKAVDNASLYGIIGIITGVVGIIAAVVALLLIFRRLS